MRIESSRPYGLPVPPSEIKENAPERMTKVPDKTGNAAGDQFELSAEHRVTRDLINIGSPQPISSTLSPERVAEIRAKVTSGYYLTSQAAEATASAVADFHR